MLLAACTSDRGPTGSTSVLTATARGHHRIQDEYHAEETYLRVLMDVGQVLPFYKVVYADGDTRRRARTVVRHRQTVPTSEWNADKHRRLRPSRPPARPPSRPSGPRTALLRSVARAGPAAGSVRTVFVNNRAASVTKHLPAFMNCG